MCLMRDNIEWRIAEIYAIREAKFFAEQVCDEDEEDYTLYDDICVLDHPEEASNQQN